MLIIEDGFAIRYEIEDETKPTARDYSHLTDADPLPFRTPTKATEPTTRAKPKKAKREDFQMQLF